MRPDDAVPLPHDLQLALDALYRTFASYRPQGPIEHSPLKPRSAVAALETKDLRDLDADDLRLYSGSAVWTVGSVSDLKYFFPRMAELALRGPVGSGGWASWVERLAPALSLPVELAVVREFFRALWRAVMEAQGEDLSLVDAIDLLRALPVLFADLSEFLQAFSPCASRAAARYLTDICTVGSADAGLAKSTQLDHWLRHGALRDLHAAAKDFPPRDDDEHAELQSAMAQLRALLERS